MWGIIVTGNDTRTANQIYYGTLFPTREMAYNYAKKLNIPNSLGRCKLLKISECEYYNENEMGD